MAKTIKTVAITDEVILNAIYLIRGQKIMIDKDLAKLYGVTTGNLNKAVTRNISRFPADFMFTLTSEEMKNLIFQNGTSNWGGTRKLSRAFTEQGVAMLSGVLNSETAIRMHIQIIRVFARMKEMLLYHKDILIQLEKIEKKLSIHDEDIQLLFKYLKQLLIPPEQVNRKRIGFKRKDQE